MTDPIGIGKGTVSPTASVDEPVKSSDVTLPTDTGAETSLAPEASAEAEEDAAPASASPAAAAAAEAKEASTMSVPRTIGLTGATSFIVGTIIGSGIFISPSGVARKSGSVAFTLCSWAICGVISMLAALCYAELGCVIKESGADYAYLHAAFGSVLSYIFCWVWDILLKPATLATLALTFARYITTPFFEDGCGQAPEEIQKLLAICVLLLLLAINIYSLKLTTRIQIIFMAAKLFALTTIIIGGLVKIGLGSTSHLNTGFNNTEENPGKIALGFYGGMFAYDAWNAANFIAEEIINPQRNLPLSIIIALPLCMTIYILTNVSYFSVMSVQDMIDSPAVALTWAERVIPAVSWMIPIFVAMSAFGSANGTIFTNARLFFVTGRNGQMPEVLGMVNIRSFTMGPASILLTFLGIVFAIAGDIASLIDFISFLAWIFYGLNMVSLIIFRYKPKYKDLPRPFRIPLFVPVFVLLCAIFIVVAPIVANPQIEFLYAIVFIAIGYLFYIPFVVFKLQPPFMKKVTMFCQLYLQVAKTKQWVE